MFNPFITNRNWKYIAHKGQIIRRKNQAPPVRSVSVPYLMKMAELTNAQGITIPNPDWKLFIPKPPQPPEPESEEEEDKPDPLIFRPTQLLLYTGPSTSEMHSIAVYGGTQWLYPYVTYLDAPIPIGTWYNPPILMMNRGDFNNIYIEILLSDVYDFSTGKGQFLIYLCQIINEYDSLIDKPPEEKFPLIFKATKGARLPFTAAYTINRLEPTSLVGIIPSSAVLNSMFSAENDNFDDESIFYPTIIPMTTSRIIEIQSQSTVDKSWRVQIVEGFSVTSFDDPVYQFAFQK